jgi:predicted ATPase
MTNMAITNITHIRLRNWKNFKQTEAKLDHRVFVIGPNASGKSNFLDVFRFLQELATSGLSKAVGARGGVSSIRCLAATSYPNVDIEVTLGSDTGDFWKYELVINQDKASRPIVKKEIVTSLVKGQRHLNRPDDGDKTDPERLTQTALEQVAANKEFREVSDFFKSISYQHLIPQVVRDPKAFTSSPVQNDPFGRDFLMRVWTTNKNTRDSRLEKIGMVLAVAVPQLQELRIDMDGRGSPHLMARYEHWRPKGAIHQEAQFSDGTLRLLGLLWSVFEGTGPLLLEEPELSLHAEVVRYLPQMFERIHRARKVKRQTIMSTHSEELLRDKSIGPSEILWLEPSKNGTLIRTSESQDQLMFDAGLTAADIFLPKSAPRDSNQLPLALDD